MENAEAPEGVVDLSLKSRAAFAWPALIYTAQSRKTYFTFKFPNCLSCS